MKLKARLEIDKVLSKLSPDNIVIELGLEEKGTVNEYFTSELDRYADRYIPFKTGNLSTDKHVGSDHIYYRAEYASIVYKSDKKFKQGRKKEWDKFTMEKRGTTILKNVYNIIKGEF